MLIDTHVNLHAEAFDADRDDVLRRARTAGVARMIAIGSRWRDLATVQALSAAHDDVFASAGAHPHHAKDEPAITAEDIAARADFPKCVAVGETGLDQHYNHSPLDDQIASFRAHIGAARLTGLPVIVHTRQSDAVTAEVLEDEYAKGAFRFLLHCYSSGADLARRGAALGAYFSVNGIMTFKKADDVRDIITDIMPADRIMLETDSPYLAPAPHRGRRNEPAYLPRVAEKLAELRGWTGKEAITRSGEAALSLFDRMTTPSGTKASARV